MQKQTQVTNCPVKDQTLKTNENFFLMVIDFCVFYPDMDLI